MLTSWVWNIKLWVANLAVFLLKAGEEVLVGGQAVFEGVMMRSPTLIPLLSASRMEPL